ncbi:MAG: hypothetical protein NT031_19455 [Planctomycetota bacterium]|nr:hypothetical protein [Planctomycetota bacterium]
MADLKSAEGIASQTGADMVASSIRTKIKSAECKAAAQKKAASLEAQLKAAPNDAPTQESLVKLYLLDLDRPSEAARFLTPDSDVAMRANIPLAAGAVGDVAAGPSLELAQWYEGLSGKASDEGAGNALRRARAYAQHFLDVHPDKDAKRLTAVNLLGKIETALEKYEPKADWVNVLKGVDLNRHVRLGTWAWSGSALGIVKARDRSRVLIPSIPDGDYELMATFSRAQGPGSTRFYLPVGGSSCTLVLGEDDDQACGLDALDDNDATVNPTRTPAPSLAGAGKHTVGAKVVHREQKVYVTVTLDGKALLAWSGTAGQLSLPDGWGLSDASALGLGAGDARVTFDSVLVRMLTGKLKDSSADESAARKAEENQNKTSKARAVRVKRVKIRLR